MDITTYFDSTTGIADFGIAKLYGNYDNESMNSDTASTCLWMNCDLNPLLRPLDILRPIFVISEQQKHILCCFRTLIYKKYGITNMTVYFPADTQYYIFVFSLRLNILNYYCFDVLFGNRSLRPGCTIAFWEKWGWREHLRSSFCYCPWLSEVYKLRLALKCGSRMQCSSHSQSSVFKN